MKKIFILIFIFYGPLLSAQTAEIDSLEKELKKHTEEDTVRLNLFNRLARNYSNTDKAKGLPMADSGISLAGKLKLPVKLAASYAAKALNYSDGNDSLAIVYYIKAIQLYEKNNFKSGMAVASHNIGLCYYNMSDFVTALEWQKKSIPLFQELKNLKGEAHSLNSIGVIYMTIGDYRQATDYYLKSLKIAEQLNDRLAIADALMNLGIVFESVKDFARSLSYYQKSLDLYEKLENEPAIARAYTNIGNTYDMMNNFSESVACYKKALEINERIKNTFGVASNLSNLGVSSYRQGMYVTAYEYHIRSIPLWEEIKDEDNLAFAYESVANVIGKTPDSLLKQINILPSARTDKMHELYNRSLKIFHALGDVAGEADVLENLSQLYESQNKSAFALSTYKQFIILRDSVLSDKQKSEIEKKEMHFNFDKKETLLKAQHDKKEALATAEIKRQRTVKNSAMGGAAVLILAGLTSFAFYKRRRDAEEEKKESDFKAEVSETEMKALRSQMNPHFIFNSLNSIGDYISRNDNKAADNYLSKFAKVMRMILENSEQKEVSLEDDLKALELYMQLESMRMNNKFTYEIKVDDAIDKENTLIPPLILQPFVENSIWHGISKKQGTGKITIIIKKEGDMINCIVEDDGIGRKKSALQQSGSTTAEKKSLGMKITKARIDIINKLKKSKAGVELSDLAEGMRVEVRLPLEMIF